MSADGMATVKYSKLPDGQIQFYGKYLEGLVLGFVNAFYAGRLGGKKESEWVKVINSAENENIYGFEKVKKGESCYGDTYIDVDLDRKMVIFDTAALFQDEHMEEAENIEKASLLPKWAPYLRDLSETMDVAGIEMDERYKRSKPLDQKTLEHINEDAAAWIGSGENASNWLVFEIPIDQFLSDTSSEDSEAE